MILYKQIFKNNQKWVEEKKASDSEFFDHLAEGQDPEILYIGCSDSRVSAEEMTGIQPGQMFVHRNVANLVPNNDNSSASAFGAGAAAANGGDANSSYSVNNSSLSGSVTGAAATTSVGGYGESSTVAINNNIDGSFNGAAGINQTVQNHGHNALSQQQVSFQGNVNVNPAP